MNRAELQQLAHMRLAEARTLAAAGHAPGAYYMVGYVIECALKACIAKAGLETALENAIRHNQSLAGNWAIVKDWNESRRYSLSLLAQDANDLVAAVSDPVNGVFPWLTQHW